MFLVYRKNFTGCENKKRGKDVNRNKQITSWSFAVLLGLSITTQASTETYHPEELNAGLLEVSVGGVNNSAMLNRLPVSVGNDRRIMSMNGLSIQVGVYDTTGQKFSTGFDTSGLAGGIEGLTLRGNYAYGQYYNAVTETNSLQRCSLVNGAVDTCMTIRDEALDPNARLYGLTSDSLNEQGVIVSWYQDQSSETSVNKLSFFTVDDGEIPVKIGGMGWITGINNDAETPKAIAIVDGAPVLMLLQSMISPDLRYLPTTYNNGSVDVELNNLVPIAINNNENPRIVLLENGATETSGRLFYCDSDGDANADGIVDCTGGLQLVNLDSISVNSSIRWHLTDQNMLIGNLYSVQTANSDDPAAVIVDLDANTYRTLQSAGNFADRTLGSWQWIVQDVSERGDILAIARSDANFFTVKSFLFILDRDLDGYNESVDAFPLDPAAWADADLDGMPNNWELQHGFNLADSSNAALDSDGDGINNLQEYITGGHPLEYIVDDRDAAAEASQGILIIASDIVVPIPLTSMHWDLDDSCVLSCTNNNFHSGISKQARFTWTYTPKVAGSYEIYINLPSDADDNDAAVKYTLTTLDSDQTYSLIQNRSGEGYLGAISLSAGIEYSITLQSAELTDQAIFADSVRIIRVGQ